jgi:predicted DNA-binding transcriptional regulator AlpA
LSILVPKSLHLDCRAATLAEQGEGAPDDLLSQRQLAQWFGICTSWLENARSKGFGPPFIRLSGSRVRYRRESVIEWLKTREQTRTGEKPICAPDPAQGQPQPDPMPPRNPRIVPRPVRQREPQPARQTVHRVPFAPRPASAA